MGWDFHTYESQPAPFIEELWLMMQIQAEATNKINSQK
jgi:hypothetical protein